MQTDPQILRTLFDAAPDGVMLCDARAHDYPVVYVNPAMAQLTGYSVERILGHNPRFLYGEDRHQDSLGRLRAALRDGLGCRVMLRNVRADGTLFFNDVTLVPLRDAAGVLTHFASFHREGGGQLRPELSHGGQAGAAIARAELAKSESGKTEAEKGDPSLNTQTMLAYVRDDKLTGLLRRSYFEDLLQRDWGLAQRESRRVTLVAFDLDFFSQYREVFGRQGADQCFRRIARVVAGCFRRATDMCARFEEDQVIALAVGMDEAEATKFVENILGRVRDLAIHHPRSSVSRYVTVSAGIASAIPSPELTKDQLIGAMLGAVRRAKDLGRNRVVCAST
ncbi:MAG TPA: diguanylate cyclase [Steroidobacteraceae bacterium]|nr:diguanylate cyclase [Steroidobacteraceae bacterium]